MKTSSFWHSLSCAMSGLRVCLKQRNARIHVVIAVLVVALATWLKLCRVEWAILALTIGTVLAAEAANTAIETIVDLVSPEYHELAKRTKDIAAGAVLLLACAAVVIGGLIFGPALLAKWNGQ